MPQIKEEYLTFLNNMVEWGVKDMSRSIPYLQQQFPELAMDEAREVLKYWNETRYQQLNECSQCKLS